MAHHTQVTGAVSELKAMQALMANGWEVAKPVVAEVYDILGRDPVNGKYARFQVKTIRQRDDRNNELVIYARKGDGKPYTPEDCEYIIGVLDDKAYMFECTGLTEYWASEARASKRWVELTVVNESSNEVEAV